MKLHEQNEHGRKCWEQVAGVAFDGGCFDRGLQPGVLGTGVCWADKEIRRLRQSLGAEPHLGEGYRFLFPGERIRSTDYFWSGCMWIPAAGYGYADSVMSYRRKIVVESDGYRHLDAGEPIMAGDEFGGPGDWHKADDTFALNMRRAASEKLWRRACPGAKLPPEEPRFKTLYSVMESADLCRGNGWGPGTILEGDEGGGPERIKITAVGETVVLAVGLSPGCTEGQWTLRMRDWRKVGGAT